MPNFRGLKNALNKLANKKQAALLSGFFKTGIGQYGEGDIFLGIKVPEQRKVARNYVSLSLIDLQKLLNSKTHEYRLTALIILCAQYKKAEFAERKKIVDFYLRNTENINNWDLVDVSCPRILGKYLLDRPRRVLYKLARSKNLWEKRIAIISTLAFIAERQFTDTLLIAKILLHDKHDLIHKAVGWMLREAGKRDQAVLTRFLDKHYKIMPRTMLRYAIEKLSEKQRRSYLEK